MSQYTKEEILQHRAEWVAALRSGKYAQARRYLRTDDGYCCLGVACELTGLESARDEEGVYVYAGQERGVLPRRAQEWLGLLAESPDSPAEVVYATMNDDGATFSQIADHFEQYGFHPSIDVLAQEGDQ